MGLSIRSTCRKARSWVCLATLLAACGGMRAPSGAPAPSYGTVVAREEAPTEAGERRAEHAREFNTEGYHRIVDNAFLSAREEPLSTFSIDVDTASYSNVRRFLHQGTLPPKDAVRIEELVNYFAYEYPEPAGDAPFSVSTEIAPAPWKPEHRLLEIGLKGRSMPEARVPPRNLVFLVDVSGSMAEPNKLPLLRRGLALLAQSLRAQDRLSIVVYAGSSGLALPPTPGDQKTTILDALGRLEAGGSTNGGEGIELAYAVARDNFVKDGINRVILATDGDFNVGTTSEGDLERLIEEKRKTGVFLTVLGFGEGNVKDSTMELLADKGNGNYAYIDSLSEARKVLVRQAGSTLVTIAKDVKIQVEFNPAEVQSYRLIGYEDRVLANRDFNDDTKDAGEIGAGHSVTALYEIVPQGAPAPETAGTDPLRYQTPSTPSRAAQSGEIALVKLRYKAPAEDTSRLSSFPIRDERHGSDSMSTGFRFAASVAAFGMLLRDSQYKGSATYASVRALAASALGTDPHGDRHELLSLIDAARSARAQ